MLYSITNLCSPVTFTRCSGEDASSEPSQNLPAVHGDQGNVDLSPEAPDAAATSDQDNKERAKEGLDKARSLVLLLATLAASITFQAGLDPPGGFWQDDADGHQAGDPILSTINAERYKVFFYCNSTAFVASLVSILLVQSEFLLRKHILEASMIHTGLVRSHGCIHRRELPGSE
jgi:hypothetical protein